MRRINVVYRDNGRGLTRDAVVLRQMLTEAGHSVTLTAKPAFDAPLEARFAPEHLQHVAARAQNLAALALRRSVASLRWDLNIFVESIDDDYVPLARTNAFLPNQEWLVAADLARMGSMDLVLFKTKHAESVLGGRAKRSVYLGYTSEDRLNTSTPRDWNRVLHVGGWNPCKGTALALATWPAHSDWPALTVLAQRVTAPDAPHVQLTTRQIPDGDLRNLQNACGVHLCASEVEGFGHSINEARSCGVLIITTDAPPMNELVGPNAGVLVPYVTTEPMGSGTRFKISSAGLERAMDQLASLGPTERAERGRAARAAYEAERSAFSRRLTEVVASS